MKLIDLLSLLDYDDFVEIMEVNTTSELHCYVKDSYNYLKKFEKEINIDWFNDSRIVIPIWLCSNTRCWWSPRSNRSSYSWNYL